MHNTAWTHHPLGKSQAITLAIVLTLAAIGTPIAFALHQAKLQGLDAAENRALLHAHDIMQRSDKTADQVKDAVERLSSSYASAPCSSEAIELMRQIDLGYTYIQAVGHVEDDTLVCSSLGIRNLALGPVDFTASSGVHFRTEVKLNFAPRDRFIVIESDSIAVIIHKDLALDITINERDASMAIFSVSSNHPLTSRGFVDPAWIKRLNNHKEVAFIDQGRVVALVHSEHYNTIAVATLPLAYANSQIRNVALLLVPIGLVSGLLVALAILYLARLQLSIVTVMKAGLRHKEFFLLYQPIVELRTGQIVGAEALIRWRRPVGETIHPDLFIPIAEKAGMIRSITRYLLNRLTEDARGIFAEYPEFHLAINLSHEDIQSFETVGLLQSMKEILGAGPQNIIVEITERGLINAALAKEIIGAIRACGINVAIDDFGTGYSSLSYLQTFDLDLLKIDKSFVETIGTEAVTGQVIHHIIEMSKDLKFEMIAEGVETKTQADFLRSRGVEYAQGWFFGKPMPLPDLIRKLESPIRPPDSPNS